MMGGAGPAHMMGGAGPGSMGHFDSTKMQQRMDRHFGVLKTQLKLTASQEGAWTSFKAALQPSADMRQHARRDELAKLPTLERMEKMKALRTQHFTDLSAAMDKRFDATRTFYAALAPEQQKIFDAKAMPDQGGGHRGGGWGRHAPAPTQPKL